MLSAGKTTAVQVNEVTVGRQILCKEDPKTPATSACAKQLTTTIDAAAKGLTAEQQKLWREMVYTPAVLQVTRHCDFSGRGAIIFPDTKLPPSSKSEAMHARCINNVLTGSWTFDGLYGGEFKWSEYLTKGAEIIKKLLTTTPCPPGQAMSQSGKCYTPGGDPAGSGTPTVPAKACPARHILDGKGGCVPMGGNPAGDPGTPDKPPAPTNPPRRRPPMNPEPMGNKLD